MLPAGEEAVRTSAEPATAVLPILTYHSLDDSDSVISVSPRRFAEQVRALHASGARVLRLGDAVELLNRGALPARSLAITFDDGFASVHAEALPVLREYGFPATLFLVTDYCGRDNGWPTQPATMPRLPLLDWRRIGELCTAGWEIGSHTRSHPELTALAADEAEEEMATSKRVLEDRLQQAVHCFAYPYGCYDDRTRALVARHFPVACSAILGFAHADSDRSALPRLDAHYLRGSWAMARLFSMELRAYLAVRRIGRALRRRLCSERPR